MLDTNVVSESVRPQPQPTVVSFLQSHDVTDFALSAMTVAELRQGALGHPREEQGLLLLRWIESLLLQYEARVLPFSAVNTHAYATIQIERAKIGRHISVPDAIIAATAIAHDLTLVTRNTRDFEDIGLSLINPWLSGS
ncbi:MAG TPA: PIN domain-containing protein [Thermomicrobiales bacterium]|nr:PIN domain-containing protein [Thermomicrobiales bacterium]